MPTTVRSHAKINLGLYIGAPRPDGFHPLVTVYQTLELYDVVTVSVTSKQYEVPAKPSIRLTTNNNRVPTDSRNTVWKMAELVLQDAGLTAQVEIHIEKRLPVQGGLGAGSANAVAALLGLETELGILNEIRGVPPYDDMELEGWGTFARWRLEALERIKSEGNGSGSGWSARRLDWAATVGSDVPLFLVGGTILGQDRGQVVSALPDIEPTWCVVATPEIGVSTPQAFRDWDALSAAEGLTAEASTVKLDELSRAYASAFAGAIPPGGQGTGSSGVLFVGGDLAGPNESALVRAGISSWIENDFECVVFPQHPSLAEIKRILLGSGKPEAALHASLSGSGSALYGLYRTRGDAEAACERLRAAGVASHLTRTLPRSKYWREMLLQ
jgi:4-diphosphocytidyl-2-C-methyl-D-erythritol kinase